MPPKINNTTYEFTLTGGDKVEVGDKDAPTFRPHLKLNRWGGECFIAIQPAGEIESEFEPELEKDKIKYKYKAKQNGFELELETEFYPLEPRTVIAKDKDGNDVPFTQNELGGFEFEIILGVKPPTNRIVLNIETQGLKFYYQPALTQEEIDQRCIRPDNVVGSYAIYHATRTNMHRSQADADKYKCGKAFHIYRPKVTDAEGNWVWAELSLDEKAGTLTTAIPQEFLNNAVYPVSIDPNFGCEAEGSSNSGAQKNSMRGDLHTTPADISTAVSISVYIKKYTAYTTYFKGIIVLHSNLNILTNGIGPSVTVDSDTYSWKTSTFAIAPTPAASTEHVLMVVVGPSHDAKIAYDAGAADQFHYDNSNSFDIPLHPTDAQHHTYLYSIYCTYEAAAAGWSGKVSGVTDPAKVMGVDVANIAKVKGVA